MRERDQRVVQGRRDRLRPGTDGTPQIGDARRGARGLERPADEHGRVLEGIRLDGDGIVDVDERMRRDEPLRQSGHVARGGNRRNHERREGGRDRSLGQHAADAREGGGDLAKGNGEHRDGERGIERLRRRDDPVHGSGGHGLGFALRIRILSLNVHAGTAQRPAQGDRQWAEPAEENAIPPCIVSRGRQRFGSLAPPPAPPEASDRSAATSRASSGRKAPGLKGPRWIGPN